MNPKKPLTTRQQEFVQHVLNGYSLADSYRIAYNSSGTSATVRVEASRLAKHPHVVAALHQLRLQRQRTFLQELRQRGKEVGLF